MLHAWPWAWLDRTITIHPASLQCGCGHHHVSRECPHNWEVQTCDCTASHSQWHNGREFKIFLSPYIISNQYTDTKLLRFDSQVEGECTQTRSEKRSHVQYFDWDLWLVWTLTSHHNKTDSWTASHKCSYNSNFTALVLTPLDPPPPSPTAAPLTTTANNYGQNNNKVHILQPQQIFLTLQIFLRVSPV